MWTPVKMMKIFEYAWLTIAAIAFSSAVYKIFFTEGFSPYVYALLFVTVLALLLFYIKMKNRHYLQKKEALGRQKQDKNN